MSLLLDALKRAEQAKQSLQVPALEPASQGTVAKATSPQQSSPAAAPSIPALTLEEIAPTPSSVNAVRASAASDREAAQNLFSSKQLAAAAPTTGSRWALPGIAIAITLLGAGGWYVWQEVSRLSGGVSMPALRAGLQTAATKVTGSVTTAEPAAPQPGAETSQISKVQPPTKDVPLPAHVASARPSTSAAERARDELVRSLKSPESLRDAPLSLKLTTGIEPPRVNAELASAYTALRSGNYGEAKRLYAAVIASDAMSPDARLGLATALARTGDINGAVREYRKALELDPRNATALASLVMLSDQSNRAALEADLRILLGRHADSAALSFALGNLLASQSRWTEAQQAYFDAYRFEPGNADYLYNLAVSLDQLKQRRLALDYYQKALALGGRGGAQFDRGQVQRRANELKSQP